MSIIDMRFKYPFKVWLFILCLAPCFGIWLDAIRTRNFESFLYLVGAPLYLLVAGFFVSTPCFAGFLFLYRFLFKRRFSVVLSKILLSAFNVGCVYLIFYLIGGNEMLEFSNRGGFLLVSSYAIFSIVGPLIFPFDEKHITEKDFTF